MRRFLNTLALIAIAILAIAHVASCRILIPERSQLEEHNAGSNRGNIVERTASDVAGDFPSKYHRLAPRVRPSRKDKDKDGRTYTDGGSSSDGDGSESSENSQVAARRPFKLDEPAPEASTEFMNLDPKTIDKTQTYARQDPGPDFLPIFQKSVDRMLDIEKPVPGKSVFYSGVNKKVDDEPGVDRSFFKPSKEWADDGDYDHYDGIYAEGIFDPRKGTELETTKPTSSLTPEELSFQQQLQSAAFARVSSGKVWIFLPNEGVGRRNTWTDFEWPELVKGGKVTHIIRVDPEMRDYPVIDGNSAGYTVIWKDGESMTTPFPLNVSPLDMKFPPAA